MRTRIRIHAALKVMRLDHKSLALDPKPHLRRSDCQFARTSFLPPLSALMDRGWVPFDAHFTLSNAAEVIERNVRATAAAMKATPTAAAAEETQARSVVFYPVVGGDRGCISETLNGSAKSLPTLAKNIEKFGRHWEASGLACVGCHHHRITAQPYMMPFAFTFLTCCMHDRPDPSLHDKAPNRAFLPLLPSGYRSIQGNLIVVKHVAVPGGPDAVWDAPILNVEEAELELVDRLALK
uniref:Uncharacterized protein n=1 Tax=Mycena chlorophos TaxID=658473 RepID=A0ABQ0KY17_MYCCL|nr:predicted protein [Mycena chlorophos]